MSDIDIARALWRHLNTWEGKPCTIGLDILKARAETTAKLQPLSGTVVTKRYITGAYIGDWPFAVIIRIQASDTTSRANAIKALYDLGQWLEAQTNPDIGTGRTAIRTEMTGLPSLSVINEDGSEEYQAIYAMTYKQS